MDRRGENGAGQPRPGQTRGWARVAHFTLADFAVLAWRERLTGLVVAGSIVLVGLVLVLMAPKAYVASARVLVLLDEAYVLNPITEINQPGSLSTEETVQAEVAYMEADEVKRLVLSALGVGRVFPKLADRDVEGGETRREALAVNALSKRYAVRAEPQSPTISLTYEDEDPARAAQVLNTLLDAYLEYRRDSLLTYDAVGASADLSEAQDRLEALNATLTELLTKNAIGDFETDRETVLRRAGAIEDALLAVQADRAEVQARLAALGAQLAVLPEEVRLEVQDTSGGRLQDLRVEREELLARYLPTSQAVEEIDRRIRRLEERSAAGAVSGGAVRRGLNPVRQELDGARAAAAAEAAALRSRESALSRQLADVRAHQQLLQSLVPQFESLRRERTALEASLDRLIQRDEQVRARLAMNRRTESQNVRIIERASPPAEGSSLRKPLFALVVFLAGLVGLASALVRGLSRPVRDRIAAAAATFGGPVLAVVRAPRAPAPAGRAEPA